MKINKPRMRLVRVEFPERMTTDCRYIWMCVGQGFTGIGYDPSLAFKVWEVSKRFFPGSAWKEMTGYEDH